MGLCKLWLEFITKVSATQAPFTSIVVMYVHNYYTFGYLGIFAVGILVHVQLLEKPDKPYQQQGR